MAHADAEGGGVRLFLASLRKVRLALRFHLPSVVDWLDPLGADDRFVPPRVRAQEWR